MFSESDLKEERYWTTFHVHNTPRWFLISDPGKAKLCLDCGKLTASFTVDLEEARKVVDRWGTDALKSRLAASNKPG